MTTFASVLKMNIIGCTRSTMMWYNSPPLIWPISQPDSKPFLNCNGRKRVIEEKP